MFNRNRSCPRHYILKILIYLSPKITLPIAGSCCVTTIIGHHQVDMLIFSLKSFFYFSKLHIPVYVFDDGSLTKTDFQKLSNHFVNINIKIQKEYINELFNKLKKFEYCL